MCRSFSQLTEYREASRRDSLLAVVRFGRDARHRPEHSAGTAIACFGALQHGLSFDIKDHKGLMGLLLGAKLSGVLGGHWWRSRPLGLRGHCEVDLP